MNNVNSVQDILADLQQSQAPATKTAAAVAPDLGAARSALQQSLHAVTTATTKTASDTGDGTSAVQELTKIASDLANADEAGQIKQAQLMGAAAMDGFIQRANQYAANAPQASVQAIHGNAKTAAEIQQEEFSVKLAADLGYAEAENAIHRLVSAEKTAADAQYQHQVQAQQAGFNATQRAMQHLAAGTVTKEAAEKQANDERIQGIMAAAEKTAAAAEDCFVRGYEEMHKIAQVLT